MSFGSTPSEAQLKRVLVVQSQLLLAAGISSLLNRELDLHVFEATLGDETTLLAEIEKIQPAVLVMDAGSQFSGPFSFLSPFNRCPDLRVIVVDERKNRMHIYENQELEIGRTVDFVNAIRREEPLPY